MLLPQNARFFSNLLDYRTDLLHQHHRKGSGSIGYGFLPLAHSLTWASFSGDVWRMDRSHIYWSCSYSLEHTIESISGNVHYSQYLIITFSTRCYSLAQNRSLGAYIIQFVVNVTVNIPDNLGQIYIFQNKHTLSILCIHFHRKYFPILVRSINIFSNCYSVSANRNVSSA